jgi:hypothetical protein
MAKGRKRNDSAGKNIKAYKHETETRKNAVPVGRASYDTSRTEPKRYYCDHYINPQLIWSEKKKRKPNDTR